MIPVQPPVYNAVFQPPEGMDHTQVFSIHAYRNAVAPGFTQHVFGGEVKDPNSNLDGAAFVVTAWKPTTEELETLNRGGVIYLSCLAFLPCHFLTTDWRIASYGQADS